MSTPQLSRRGILRTASGTAMLAVSGISAFAASDFWNKKASAEWSEAEILQLKTKSPWAKKVHLESSGGRGGGRGGDGGRGGEGGGMGADSGGSGGGGGGGGRGGSRGIRPGEPNPEAGGSAGGGIDVFVRWESAAPLMEATKLKLPPTLENHYCISVTGLPPQMLMMLLNGGGRGRGRDQSNAAEAPPEDPAARQKAAIGRLLHSATLTAKGKDPQSPDMVMQTGDKQSLIFGFPKQSPPLTAADKEVQFTMNLGMFPIKAKFELKEMVFKGELTV